jgi:hypothetical protein
MCGGKNVDGPVEKPKEVPNQTESKTASVKATTMVAPVKRVATRKFLDAILANKELTAALEQFLQAEFCIENLLFLQKTASYRELYQKANLEKQEDRVKLGEIRDFIQKEFMLPSSEKEVIHR